MVYGDADLLSSFLQMPNMTLYIDTSLRWEQKLSSSVFIYYLMKVQWSEESFLQKRHFHWLLFRLYSEEAALLLTPFIYSLKPSIQLKKTDATADQTKRWCFCSDALSLWYTDAQQSLQAAYNECFSSQIPPVLVVWSRLCISCS